jgi:hypothetical protein
MALGVESRHTAPFMKMTVMLLTRNTMSRYGCRGSGVSRADLFPSVRCVYTASRGDSATECRPGWSTVF